MKLDQLLSETEINEFDVPVIGKKAKAQRAATKKFSKSIDSEVSNMEVELKNFMRASKTKVATPQVVLDYLTKKGLGQAAQAVIKDFVTGSQKMQNVATAAGQAVGKGISKAKSAASAVGQAAKNVAGKLKPTPQSQPAPTPAAQLTPSQRARAAQWQRSRFNEQVEMDTPLSTRDVRNMLKQAVEKGFATNPSFAKSKFASDTDAKSAASAPQQKPKFPADVVNAVSKLSPEQRKQLAQLLQR